MALRPLTQLCLQDSKARGEIPTGRLTRSLRTDAVAPGVCEWYVLQADGRAGVRLPLRGPEPIGEPWARRSQVTA